MRHHALLYFFSLSGLLLHGCAPFGNSSDSITGSTQITTGAEMGIGLTAFGGNAVAQSFQLPTNGTISRVDARLFRVGTFAANDAHSLTMTIETSSGTSPSDSPTGTVIATGTVPITSVTATTATFYTFDLGGTFNLNGNQTYWIKITANYGVNGTNYISWAGHDTTDSYTAGHAAYFTGTSTWSTALIGTLRDLVFTTGS